MIQHVYESVLSSRVADRVVVATDDERIRDAVRSFGGRVYLTSTKHPSGTDRLAEVARKLRVHWIINVQGDLPFIEPETIRASLAAVTADASIPMGTAMTPIVRKQEFANTNVVKVVTDSQGFALYFSRSRIPYHRDRTTMPEKWGDRHVGIYVYRRDFLLRFSRLAPAPLEKAESLEQLRALYYGYRVRVASVHERSVEVDTPDDLRRAERYWRLHKTKD